LYSIDIYQDEIIFHPSKATFNDQYLTALEIIHDEIWIANRQGIAYWDYKNDSWYSYPALSMKFIIRDIESSDDVVWFATDKGVLKYDRLENYWRIFTKEDGLMSNDVYHLDLEGDILWISTDTGITLFYWNDPYRMD
jgi:ligand-binding sensor domain-containing protein